MINLYIYDLCNNSSILRLFLLLSYVFKILCVLLPLLLMFKCFQTCYKHVVSGEPISKSLPDIAKKFIAAVIIFFIPTICGAFFNLVDDYSKTNESFNTCFENINLDYIQDLQKEELEHSSEDVNDTSTITPNQPLLWPEEEDSSSNNNSSNNNNNSSNTSSNTGNAYGNLYVGDSRTVGMGQTVSMGSTDSVYATSGGAMDAYNKDIAKALNIINNNPDKRYNIVLNYGVNNLGADWVGAYKKLISDVDGRANILVVSINPCNDSIALYCRNANIVPVNNKLKNAFSSGYENVKYCDTYSAFVNTNNYLNMIETQEGIHYTREGYNFINNEINKCLNNF